MCIHGDHYYTACGHLHHEDNTLHYVLECDGCGQIMCEILVVDYEPHPHLIGDARAA